MAETFPPEGGLRFANLMISRHEKVKFIILRTIGNFLLLFSIYGTLRIFGPVLYLEMIYRLNQVRNIHYEVDKKIPVSEQQEQQIVWQPTPTITQKPNFFGQLLGGNKIEILSPVSSQYGLVIPKIGANAPIFPNVDAGKPDIYLPVLQQGIAHALGTVFPGVAGNIYLFAHSTDNFWNVGRYNAVFYLLDKLENGDEIDVFYQGVRHVYRVVNKLIVNPSEVNYLTKPTPYEQLTLQTCWPAGTTLKRLIVLARPENDLVRGF